MRVYGDVERDVTTAALRAESSMDLCKGKHVLREIEINGQRHENVEMFRHLG